MKSIVRMVLSGCLAALVIVGVPAACPTQETKADTPKNPGATAPLDFQIKVETVLKSDDRKFLWFHPRVTPLPGFGSPGKTAALMTLQQHLHISDYYSGLYTMQTIDTGKSWTGPTERPELAWRREGKDVVIAVADVTPGWHAPTKKVIAIGAHVRYGTKGEQLDDKSRAHQTAYAVHDPATGKWSDWRILDMPRDAKFNYARSACAQWLVEPDGTLLVPFYFGHNAKDPFSVAVVKCSFDGKDLTYQKHGTELSLQKVRGLVEPSLIRFGKRYYLTIRNDERGYVTVSDDGLDFKPIAPWTFDDGKELGSYNTQQHWLAHSHGLFLTYTRRGANNDHVMRHRAPLFIAAVDPDKLVVRRSSEQVLIPERGATLGNFGASAINESESWVTVAEGVWNDEIRKRGAEGALFVARVLWSKPNKLVADQP